MTPQKPFPTYKWHWLSFAPTEGLLDPPVFLGVLRVLRNHQGIRPSNPDVLKDLKVVQIETNTRVNLERTPERNLIRNSGQYWKGTGLLSEERGLIRLTPFGERVASGGITTNEFAAIMVQQTVLPNPWTYDSSEIDVWKSVGLEIRPLALILEIIKEIGKQGVEKGRYLTTEELTKIVIPLAGQNIEPSSIAAYILKFRSGELDVSDWPDCVPEANDVRIAREFLLFLHNFGLCKKKKVKTHSGNSEERFILSTLSDFEDLVLDASGDIYHDEATAQTAIDRVINSSLPSIIERQKEMVSVAKRKGQTKFREDVLRSYDRRCFITGERISEVLEAAHIIPFERNGANLPENGFCMRVDLHKLFDAGHIRIHPSGSVIVSEAVSRSPNYRFLPENVAIPNFVNPSNIKWRLDYL